MPVAKYVTGLCHTENNSLMLFNFAYNEEHINILTKPVDCFFTAPTPIAPTTINYNISSAN